MILVRLGKILMKRKSIDPTLLDVAERSGVSIATVSRVLNARHQVKPSTAKRVCAAMDELGYPYQEAVNTQKNNLIAVVLPNMDNPFYAKIVHGIQASARSHHHEYTIYLCKDVDLNYRQLVDCLHMMHACGVILLSPVNDSEVLRQINAAAPVVQCAEYNAKSPLPYVAVDDFSASKSAVEYLISKGRQRIALINGPQKYKYARHRYEGYAAALKDAGLSLEPSFVFYVTEMSFDGALSVARQLLLGKERPDAILAASDVFAAAAIKAASGAGLLVPQDLAVLSFDNTFVSSVSHPSITVVNMPQFQLGYVACELLADRMLNPAGEHQSIVLNTELVIRESV